MVEVKGLSYTYRGGRELRFDDLSIANGEHCLLLGESGCGKTTLLHLLGGLLRPSNGSIEIDGNHIAAMSEVQLDSFRGRHLGFVFQRNHLVDSLSVRRNLLLARYLSGQSTDQREADQLLEHLGLNEKSESSVTALSYGQAQRVAIARAVINKPSVILADEPTSALDDKNCEAVISLLTRVASENNSTLIIATHDQRLKSQFKKQVLLKSA